MKLRIDRAFRVTALSAVLLGALGSAQTPPTPPTPAAPPSRSQRVVVHLPRQSYLGVDIEDLTPDRVSALKLKDDRGVEITMVDQDAPAGKAGLHEHDVITSYNGTPVEGEEQLRRLIRETPPGRTVHLGISRDGNALDVPVALGKMPAHEAFNLNMPAMPKMVMPPMAMAMAPRMANMPDVADLPQFDVMMRSYVPHTGIVAESLTPQLATYFGAKAGEGVLVRNVDKGSAAEKAGLKAGDVITTIGGEKISDRSDVRRLLRNKSGHVAVTVLRDKREQTFTLNLPERKQSGALEDEDLQIDLAPVADELARLQPQIQQAAMLAQDQALKATMAKLEKMRPEIEKSVHDAQKEVERSMKQMQKDLEKLNED